MDKPQDQRASTTAFKCNLDTFTYYISAFMAWLRSLLSFGNEKTHKKKRYRREKKNTTVLPLDPWRRRLKVAPLRGCNQDGNNQLHGSPREQALTSPGNGKSAASQGHSFLSYAGHASPFLVLLDIATENMAASVHDFSRSGTNRTDPSSRPSRSVVGSPR
ncbi:unnamed protein product [Ectocarpus sp. 12 AP-2014]